LSHQQSEHEWEVGWDDDRVDLEKDRPKDDDGDDELNNRHLFGD